MKMARQIRQRRISAVSGLRFCGHSRLRAVRSSLPGALDSWRRILLCTVHRARPAMQRSWLRPGSPLRHRADRPDDVKGLDHARRIAGAGSPSAQGFFECRPRYSVFLVFSGVLIALTGAFQHRPFAPKKIFRATRRTPYRACTSGRLFCGARLRFPCYSVSNSFRKNRFRRTDGFLHAAVCHNVFPAGLAGFA